MSVIYYNIIESLLKKKQKEKDLIKEVPKTGKTRIKQIEANAISEGYMQAIDDFILMLEESEIQISEEAASADYVLASDESNLNSELKCGCLVNVLLEEAADASKAQRLGEIDVDIDYCTEHDGVLSDYGRQYARKLWLEDPNAKFDHRYRELFETVRDDF